MIFFSDKPEKNGPRVAARLRKELGAPAPLEYTTARQADSVRPSSLRAALGEAIGEAIAQARGGDTQARAMYTFHFALTAPRPWEIQVVVENHGGTSVVGAVQFTTRLPSARLAAAVMLGEEKTFGRSTFAGDPAACARLNADKALLSRLHGWIRGSFEVGKLKVTGPRLVKAVPDIDGALLCASTLPRPRWFGTSAAFDADAFLWIAAAAERTLANSAPALV